MSKDKHEEALATVRSVTNGRHVKSVLITGADGYVGRLVVAQLAKERGDIKRIIATDVRPTPSHLQLPDVQYEQLDIRTPALVEAIGHHQIDTVIHLAAVVTPRPGDDRAFQYAVDVEGTRNVVNACLTHNAGRLVYTSSGAAYGYSPANPALLNEDESLRAEEAFAYSWHKRLVEEMLAETREEHPELEQVVLRVSTVLGETVANQITAMFERKVIVGIAGAASPFCFIWDRDLAACIVNGVRHGRPGVYNITGDGVMTLKEIAKAMGRPFVSVRADLVQGAIRLLNRLGKVTYGPEQIRFLRYRPVLDNRRLKSDFGFRPQRTSREVFELYRAARRPDGRVGVMSHVR